MPSSIASICSLRLKTPDALSNSFTMTTPEPPLPPSPAEPGVTLCCPPPPPPPLFVAPASPGLGGDPGLFIPDPPEPQLEPQL